MKLTPQEVDFLIQEQIQINKNFSVSRWDDDLVETALITEYSEFMNELQTLWKVWKKVEDNIPNAKVEFIDCVHFMLSLMILRSKTDPEGLNIHVECDILHEQDFLKRVNRCFKLFLNSENSIPSSRFYLITFVDYVTEFLDMDKTEFFKHFETKKQINIERANNGYLQGTYSGKDQESLRFL